MIFLTDEKSNAQKYIQKLRYCTGINYKKSKRVEFSQITLPVVELKDDITTKQMGIFLHISSPFSIFTVPVHLHI